MCGSVYSTDGGEPRFSVWRTCEGRREITLMERR
jgi:hypothetical protein